MWLTVLITAFSAFAIEATTPVTIGITAEFGIKGSHAAQSIDKGISLAISEVNAAGGVLGGRRLAVERRDDRGVPARGMDNFRELAANPTVVAVFCGRFSPVALELVPLANKLGLPLLDPWAAADSITADAGKPSSHVFRLSLTDSWAMATMLDYARQQGHRRLALFVPNTAWGRSSEAALGAYLKRHPGLSSETFWYNWGDVEFSDRLQLAKARGAEVLIAVANEAEGLPLVRQMAQLPAAKRLPILSHWGVIGGDFAGNAGEALTQVDFAVVHTFSFAERGGPRVQRVAEGYRRLFGEDVSTLRAQVGFAHAYDLTHLLARAIDKAGSTDRASVRSALEQLGPHDGLLRRYERPFTPQRHEALERKDVRLGRFNSAGQVISLGGKTNR
ncbi:MAG: ABC transporter substrate-binding protein [Dechloromonas sp.]|nr:MAG: ABC transporter substrate-binding protein [Dechloromonas sp.]